MLCRHFSRPLKNKIKKDLIHFTVQLACRGRRSLHRHPFRILFPLKHIKKAAPSALEAQKNPIYLGDKAQLCW